MLLVSNTYESWCPACREYVVIIILTRNIIINWSVCFYEEIRSDIFKDFIADVIIFLYFLDFNCGEINGITEFLVCKTHISADEAHFFPSTVYAPVRYMFPVLFSEIIFNEKYWSIFVWSVKLITWALHDMFCSAGSLEWWNAIWLRIAAIKAHKIIPENRKYLWVIWLLRFIIERVAIIWWFRV